MRLGPVHLRNNGQQVHGMPLQSLVEEPGVALHKVGVPADLREFVVFLNCEGGALRLLVAFKLRFGVHLIPHAREIFIVVVGGAGNTLLDHLERKRNSACVGSTGQLSLGSTAGRVVFGSGLPTFL